MRTTLLLLAMTTSMAIAATEEELSKTFVATPDGRLVVDVKFGSITVTTNDINEVAVDVWRKITRPKKKAEEEFLRQHPVILEQDGDLVSVRCLYREKKGLFNMGGRKRNEARYIVRVPPRFNLELGTAGGPITIRDITGTVKAHTSGGSLEFTRLIGPLTADTSGGPIDLTDCEGPIEIETHGGGITVAGGGGSLDGETSGGKVTVKDFEGDARVGTSGGGIVIENVLGEIRGHTSGGRVVAVFPESVQQPVSLTTSGGGITIRVPENASFELDARSAGGGVSSELSVNVSGKVDRGRLQGSVNGGGPEVRLRSSGGGVHIKKL